MSQPRTKLSLQLQRRQRFLAKLGKSEYSFPKIATMYQAKYHDSTNRSVLIRAIRALFSRLKLKLAVMPREATYTNKDEIKRQYLWELSQGPGMTASDRVIVAKLNFKACTFTDDVLEKRKLREDAFAQLFRAIDFYCQSNQRETGYKLFVWAKRRSSRLEAYEKKLVDIPEESRLGKSYVGSRKWRGLETRLTSRPFGVGVKLNI
jgi:hypothetical protein